MSPALPWRNVWRPDDVLGDRDENVPAVSKRSGFTPVRDASSARARQRGERLIEQRKSGRMCLKCLALTGFLR